VHALWTCLLWLDADPARFWFAAWTAFGVTILLALRAPGERKDPGTAVAGGQGWWWFAGCVFLTLAAFRWPSWFVPGDLNPDEAQILAGAITLQHFPVYWKFVDGSTHGPLCEYLLLAANWLGAPLNYVTARALAAGLQGLALIGVWGTLRCFTSERLARLAILPGLAFWSFVSWHDFVHYSTELPGIPLLALAGWAVAAVLASPSSSHRDALLLYLGGLCLGAVPFAKLQSAPQAAAMAAIALLLLWFAHRDPLRLFARRAGWLVLGGVTPVVAVLVFLLVYGLQDQFWSSYILNNVGYTGLGQHPLKEMPGWFFHFASTSSAFAWFLSGCIGFALLYARPGAGRPAPLRIGIMVSWLLLGVAYVCVLSSSREAAHYLHLLVIPAATLSGFVLAAATSDPSDDPGRLRPRWTPVLLFGLLAVAPQLYDRASTWHQYLGRLAAHEKVPLSDTARFIRERAQPGDTLAMWGWEPGLFVDTGLAQGTREAHSACQLTTWPMQAFYVERYVRDMLRRRPVWFVDAVGPGGFIYEDRREFAHERTAPLRDLIARDYVLLAEFKNKRIYRLRDAGGQ